MNSTTTDATPDPTREEYLSPADCAKILRCCLAKVYRLMEHGTLPYVKVRGCRMRRVARADLAALIEPGRPRRKPPEPVRQSAEAKRWTDGVLREICGEG